MRSTILAFLLLSARGGVAALAAWLVCRALRRAHAPSRLLCWLWLAVGLRFVLPWGIPLKLPRPESAPLAAAADTVQELGELPLLPPAPAAAAAAAPLPWYARLTPWHALAAVWLVGVLVLAVRGGIGYLKLKRCVALACKTPDGCYGGASACIGSIRWRGWPCAPLSMTWRPPATRQPCRAARWPSAAPTVRACCILPCRDAPSEHPEVLLSGRAA